MRAFQRDPKLLLLAAALGVAAAVSVERSLYEKKQDAALYLPAACRPHLLEDFVRLSDHRPQAAGESVLAGGAGGSWTFCTHLKTYGINFSPFFARHLAFGLKPSRVLEFGCGLGTTSDFLARFVPGGSEVICIEPQPMLGEVFGNRNWPMRPLQLAFDATSESECASRLFSSKMGHELVLSLEVAEHIPAKLHPRLIGLLARATAKYLVFTAARPGQGGTGHLNESMRTKSEWIRAFEGTGLLVHLPRLSMSLAWSAKPERA